MPAVHSKISYLLSRIFSYPEQDPVRAGLTQALAGLAADMDLDAAPSTDITWDLARVEYTRLFVNAVGGVPAPPYASVYRSGARILMQQGLDEAIGYYRQAGVEPDSGPEPADHISVELAFVARLLETGNRKLLKDFLRDHLLKWYPVFFERLLAAQPHPYYETAARLTRLFLQNLCQEDSYEQTTVS